MNWFKPALVAITFALTGCAATVQKSTPATSSAPSSIAPAAAQAPVRMPEEASKRLVLNMTGSKASIDAKDWVSFKQEWRAIFQEQVTAAGLKFDFQDGDARPNGEPGTLLTVFVNDYRYVGIGARLAFGIMTGNAYVDATLRFRNLRDGATFGEQAYNTSSSAWHGVFAAMTPKQIYAIADEVIREMKTR